MLSITKYLYILSKYILGTLLKSNLKLIDEIGLLKDDKIYLKSALRDISDRVDKIIKEAKLEGTNEIKLSQIIALKRNIEKYKYVKN